MMRWYGKLLGLLVGWLLIRHPVGGVVGLLIGHVWDMGQRQQAQDNPYQVLDLSHDATEAEIDRAYRRLISQYHPDKCAGMTEELRRKAERKAGEINAAYDRIKTLRKR